MFHFATIAPRPYSKMRLKENNTADNFKRKNETTKIFFDFFEVFKLKTNTE